ncbi:MAG TPA: amidohydrolase family protein [Spirochaetia bacterium]|nr:amidohydrolase family protein [Spirochaetia bacterium]
MSLETFVHGIPVIDVHEHHMPDTLGAEGVGLLDLLQESYAGWTQVRPYPLAGESRVTLGARPAGSTRWKDIAAYTEGSGTNAAVRNMLAAVAELHGLGAAPITEKNWAELDARIRERHRDRGWPDSVMQRTGVSAAISDPYTDPLMDVRAALGPRYWSVLRVNALAFGWNDTVRDHNDHNGRELLSRIGVQARSFDDYLAGLPLLMDRLAGLHKVGLKNALAYDRSVDFDTVDLDQARAAWDSADPSPAQRKAFGDVVVDRLARLAGERDIPFQVHLGSAQIRGSRPLSAAGLIERNPRTRFLLMHLAWPWSDELLGMAFVYRNVWLDLTWSWLLSPSRFLASFRQAIDSLPDESRMMLGGDTWHAEEAYGAISLARRLLSRTLEACVRDRDFRVADAERLARKILHDNAAAFFHLG